MTRASLNQMVDSEGILFSTMSLLIGSRFALHFSTPDSLRKVQQLGPSDVMPTSMHLRPVFFRVTVKEAPMPKEPKGPVRLSPLWRNISPSADSPPSEIRVKLLHVLYVLSSFVVTWRSVFVLLAADHSSAAIPPPRTMVQGALHHS